MTVLLDPRVWVGLVIAFLLSMVGVQQVRVSNAKAKAESVKTEFANYRAAAAETSRLAERSRRDTEQRWARAVEEVSNAGQQKIDRAVADAASSRPACEARKSVRLRWLECGVCRCVVR